MNNYLPPKVVQNNGFSMVYASGVNKNTPELKELLVRRLLKIMPNSFSPVIRMKQFNWDEESVLILGESSIYTLFIADSDNGVAIVLGIKINTPDYARIKLNAAAKRIFDMLSDDYELTIRISDSITHNYTALKKAA